MVARLYGGGKKDLSEVAVVETTELGRPPFLNREAFYCQSYPMMDGLVHHHEKNKTAGEIRRATNPKELREIGEKLFGGHVRRDIKHEKSLLRFKVLVSHARNIMVVCISAFHL